MGGVGAAAIFSMQATMSVSLAHTASRIFSIFRRPMTVLTLACASLPIQGFKGKQQTEDDSHYL